jgi:hypothetical protein
VNACGLFALDHHADQPPALATAGFFLREPCQQLCWPSAKTSLVTPDDCKDAAADHTGKFSTIVGMKPH